MSVDYTTFMEGLSLEMEHLKDVYRGEAQEQELDHSYLAISIIPVLLNSSTSIEMRSYILRQYVEIQGRLRDNTLANMTRSAFYSFAAIEAEKEAKYYDQKRANSFKVFSDLVEYLGDDEQAILNTTIAEHTLFKSQLSNVIKSIIGIPEENPVGPKDVEEYLSKQRIVTK